MNPSTPITNALGPNWEERIRAQIKAYCWKSKTGRERALSMLDGAKRACATSYDHCMAFSRTWSHPRGMEVIDQNAFWDEWKAWVEDRRTAILLDVVRVLAFNNKYSSLYTPPEKVKSLAASIIHELKKEGFGPEVFYGSLTTADKDPHQEIVHLRLVLQDLGWDVPFELLRHGEENYMARLRHINEVIRKKWEVAQCLN